VGDPGLLVLLEVEVLQRVQFLRAPSHHVAVPRDRVRHVEVVHVLNQRSSVKRGFSVGGMSKLFKAGGLNEVVLNQVRGELSDPGSELLESVVRKRSSHLFRKSSKHHPVVLGEPGGGKSCSGLLGPSVDVDESSSFLKIAGSREDEISVKSSLVASVTLVNDEGVLGDLFVSEVVSTEKEDDLGRDFGLGLGGDSEFEGIEFANIVVQDVESVPVFFLIDKVGVLLKAVYVVHQSRRITPFKGQRADHYHWQIGSLHSLREGVSSLRDLLQSLSRVAEMGVVEGHVGSRADYHDFESVYVDGFLDSGVHDGVLELGVAAHEHEQVGFVDAGHSRVHQVLASEVSVEVRRISSNVDVFAVE